MCRWMLIGLLISASPAFAEPTAVLEVPETAALTGRRMWSSLAGLFGTQEKWRARPEVSLQLLPTASDIALEIVYERGADTIDRVYGTHFNLVRLPSRRNRHPGDRVRIRARAAGFVSKDVQFSADRPPRSLLVELLEVKNTLALGLLTHVGERTRLTLEFQRKPKLRSSQGKDGAVSLAFTGTRDPGVRLASQRGGWIERLEPVQLYEDLLVHVHTQFDGEPRLRQSYNKVTDRHEVVLELGPDARPPTADDILREIRSATDVIGRCERAFEEALVAQLAPDVRTSTHRFGGRVAAMYRRSLLESLGTLKLPDGTQLRADNAVQLEMALQRAPEVRGFVARADQLARTNSDPDAALRTLVAPNVSPPDFDRALAIAREHADRCRESR